MNKSNFRARRWVLVVGVLASFAAAYLATRWEENRQEEQVNEVIFTFKDWVQSGFVIQQLKIDSIAVMLEISPQLRQASEFAQLGENFINAENGILQMYLISKQATESNSLNAFKIDQGYPRGIDDLPVNSGNLVSEFLRQDFAIPRTLDKSEIALVSGSGEHLIYYREIDADEESQAAGVASKYLVAQINLREMIQWLLRSALPQWPAMEFYSLDDYGEKISIYRYAAQETASGAAPPKMTRAEQEINLLEQEVFIDYALQRADQLPSYLALAPVSAFAVGLLITTIVFFFVNLIINIKLRDDRLKQALIAKSEQLTQANERLLADSDSREAMLEEIAETKERLSLMTDAIDGVVWARDYKTNKYLHVSSGVMHIFGYTPEEVQATPNLLYDLIIDEDKPLVEKAFAENIAKGQSFQVEFRTHNREGEILFGRNVITPVYKDGEVTAVCGVMFDVTKYKLMTKERNQMEVQLRQAQKLESIGQLAAGIAHEINTPAQFVGDNIHFLQDSFADLAKLNTLYQQLLESLEKGEDPGDLVEQVKSCKDEIDVDYLFDDIPESIRQSADGVERISSIVKAMKSFSHPGSSEKELVDINAAIDSTVIVARNEWKYLAELKTDFAPDLPMLHCLPGEINQTILNMVVNAAHAIEEKQKKTGDSSQGLIEISTSYDDDNVYIKIGDSGSGISQANLNKIFDPFFTTKEVGKGTGQGLSLAFSVIVDKHNGKLDVTSEEGKGTTFIITIPIEKPEAEELGATATTA